MSKAPDRMPWDGIIVTDADTCFGKARIAGTRIYVDIILQGIEGGWSIDDVLDAYPHITRKQVQAALGFAPDFVAAKRNRLKGDPACSTCGGARGRPAFTLTVRAELVEALSLST